MNEEFVFERSIIYTPNKKKGGKKILKRRRTNLNKNKNASCLSLTQIVSQSFFLALNQRENILNVEKYLVCVFCALHSIAWTKLKILLPCRVVPFHAVYAWFGWKAELKFSLYFLYMIFHRDSTWSTFFHFALVFSFSLSLSLARISWEISFSIYFPKSIFSSIQIVFFVSSALNWSVAYKMLSI